MERLIVIISLLSGLAAVLTVFSDLVWGKPIGGLSKRSRLTLAGVLLLIAVVSGLAWRDERKEKDTLSDRRAAFNNVPNAFATLAVANYTTNPGSEVFGGNVSASEGDVVSFRIAYVNTEWGQKVVARGTRVEFGVQPGAGVLLANARLSAENASAVSGSASVMIKSGRSVFVKPLSGEWYVGWRRQPLPGGPGIFDLGDIPPGWPSSGTLVLRYQVMPLQSN